MSEFTLYCLTLLMASATTYLVFMSVYRLFLHPLAKVPGPRLAAISGLYMAYYDLVMLGGMVEQLEVLHEKYGSISAPPCLINNCHTLITGYVVRIAPGKVGNSRILEYLDVQYSVAPFQRPTGFRPNIPIEIHKGGLVLRCFPRVRVVFRLH